METVCLSYSRYSTENHHPLLSFCQPQAAQVGPAVVSGCHTDKQEKTYGMLMVRHFHIMVCQCTTTKVGSWYSSHSELRKIKRIYQRSVTVHSCLIIPSQWAATVRVHLSSSLKMLFCDWGLGVSSAHFLLAGGLWGAGATLFTAGAGVTAVAALVSSWNAVWEMKLEPCALTTPSTTSQDNGTSTSWPCTVIIAINCLFSQICLCWFLMWFLVSVTV